MNLHRLHYLLVLWLVFLILPGTLVSLGLFGLIDPQKIGTLGVFIWILGYLAQFGIFMWLTRISGKDNILGWIFASLLPWAIDWTLPVSLWYLPLWTAVAIGLALWISFSAGRSDTLQRAGVHANGVVVKVYRPWFNVVVNNVYIRRKLRLRIERSDGVTPYEVDYRGLFMIGNIPSEGDRLPLRVDPLKPNHIEYEHKLDPSQSGSRRSAASSAPGRNIAEELEKIAALRERGDLSETEFNAAKSKILRG